MWRWKCICFGRSLAAAFGGVSTSLSLSHIAALTKPMLTYHAKWGFTSPYCCPHHAALLVGRGRL